MNLVNVLDEIAEKKISRSSKIKRRIISLIVDFDTETYELFCVSCVLLWGVWIINPKVIIPPDPWNLLTAIMTRELWGGLAIVLAIIHGIALLNSKVTIQSIRSRKRALTGVLFFWVFILTMFCIYDPYSSSTPIYFTISVFVFWQCLRLKSRECDLING